MNANILEAPKVLAIVVFNKITLASQYDVKCDTHYQASY